MNTLKLVLGIVMILLTNLELKGQKVVFDRKNDRSYSLTSKKIIVPEGKGKQIITDGMFSSGEWNDALSFPITDSHNIYFMADSVIFYVGLKFAKPIGVCVCEMRITSDGEEVFLFHVSGALGEGVSDLPLSKDFKLNNNKYWEANYFKADSIKKEAWLAAGQPISKHDEIYDKREGIEFKIFRKKFNSNSLKLTIGWTYIEVVGDDIDRKIYNYPMNSDLRNVNNWVELSLPIRKKEN